MKIIPLKEPSKHISPLNPLCASLRFDCAAEAIGSFFNLITVHGFIKFGTLLIVFISTRLASIIEKAENSQLDKWLPF